MKYVFQVLHLYLLGLGAEKCQGFKHSQALTLSRDTPYIKPSEPFYQAPPIQLLTLPAGAAAAKLAVSLAYACLLCWDVSGNREPLLQPV